MNTMKNKYIAQLGSNWNNWDNAGSFYWNLNNSVGNRNRNIRCHLIIAKYSRVETSGYADDYYIRNIKPNTKKGLNAA